MDIKYKLYLYFPADSLHAVSDAVLVCVEALRGRCHQQNCDNSHEPTAAVISNNQQRKFT